MNNLKLRKVINASGKMTILGVSCVSDEVVKAQKFGAQNFFVMEELMTETGRYLAELTGYQSAYIVASAASGIAQSIAALIGQGDMYHALHPYTNRISKREIVYPKGHNVDFGAPIETMISIGGGKGVEAGYSNGCTEAHVEGCITEQTAALFYVISHHAVQKNILSLDEMIGVAKKHQLPIIVDAAAEEDICQFVDKEIDLVIFGGAKAIEGPSSGIVFGSNKAVSWVRLQGKGLGRAMKIGKENVLGLTEAVRIYLEKKHEDKEEILKRIRPFVDNLNKIDGIKAQIVQDGAGRLIYRAEVILDPEQARFLVHALEHRDPAIYSRNYNLNQGRIEYDIRALDDHDIKVIVKAIKEVLGK